MQMKRLYQAGGISAILLGVSYIVITLLYVIGGALPGGAEAWLKHLAAHSGEWRAILALSVLTDFLFIPVMWALYNLLKEVNKNAVLAGAGFVGLFVVLDLAVTWPNYASLISLGGQYAAAVDHNQAALLVAPANYAVGVLSSGLFGVYAILVPALGIFILGPVMLKGNFGKAAAYIGIITGILGIVSVIGPVFIAALGMAAVITSVFTIVWVLLVGFKLLKLSFPL